MEVLCPCKSHKTYDLCCKPYHDGLSAPDALALMRSRFSAYALEKIDYIMVTTHPKNPFYQSDSTLWARDIFLFCRQNQFVNLVIDEFIDGEAVSFVTFTAHLKQGQTDTSFTETSLFEKIDNKWYYRDAVSMSGCGSTIH